MPHNRFARWLGLGVMLVAVLVTAQVLLAQDDDRPDDLIDAYTFRSIDAIIDAPLEVTNFAGDGTASLPIETRVPVACTVVYGTTTDFGQLSLDMDMAGGTHSVHNPLLSGLAPETAYYFRVQGVDDAGIVYLSEVMTFTPPAFSDAPTENLLAPERGAEVLGYSSAFGGADPAATWGILNAFDGSPNSAWSSAGDGNDAWVEVRLAERSRIDRVEFWTRTMPNDTAQIFAFTVTTETGETYGPFELPDADQAYTFEVEIVAETLRFDVVSSNGGNTGAVEIAVYGAPVE